MSIRIDEEFRSLIPPLRPDELAGLEVSLKAEGCRDPLVIWASAGILLDGHNRKAICDRLGIPYRTIDREFPDRDTAKLWVIRNQLGRRNLADIDRIALARQAEGLIAEKAEKNLSLGGKAGAEFTNRGSVNLPKAVEPTHTRVEAAKLANVSERTYEKGKAILDRGSPELIQATRDKKASIDAAATVAELPKPVQAEVVAKGEKAILAEAKRIKAEKAERQRQEREAARLAEMQARAKAIEESLPINPPWKVIAGDCRAVLGEIVEHGHEKPRLIFADPPYNIGIDYGDHMDDGLPEKQFFDWLGEVIEACRDALADDGSFWLLMNHECGYRAAYLAENAGLHLHQWLTWFESFGVNCSTKFNRCSRPLLWFVKDPKRFVFRDAAPEIRRPSDREAKYGDARASGDGKFWDDIWGINPAIPRVTGTSTERIPTFPTQLPIKLLIPIVACASEADDLVCDPFNGSGTTGAACLSLGRRYLGIEASESFAQLSRARLRAHYAETTRRANPD